MYSEDYRDLHLIRPITKTYQHHQNTYEHQQTAQGPSFDYVAKVPNDTPNPDAIM